MPRPRKFQLSPSKPSHYHCISRVVDRNFVFGTHERDVFRKVLRQVEGFTGVRVLTWTILSNHFHLLLEVPAPPAIPLGDEEILRRCQSLYPADSLPGIEAQFADAQRIGGAILERLRDRYLRRMWDLSEFMKTLKQKFTGWFNRKHGRVGTLWESRFKSIVVEGSWKCLLKVAAYVDLNAVRAGLVEDPKDYRWSGYGEAVAGDPAARRGLAAALCEVKRSATWCDVGPRYRKILFGIGEEHGASARGISRDEVVRVFEAGGQLTAAQLLRCRVRYFTDGLVIGSERFVEEFFRVRRGLFGARRQSGSRRMRGGDWGELRSARDLAVDPIAPSSRDG